jgi:hypothetical protein
VRHPVHFIPIATTIIAFAFAVVIFNRYRTRRSGPHLLWWGAGVLLYGVGTLTESLVTLMGWHEAFFRSWYISGALLGGAPLAQGTVYLLFSRRLANRLAILLLIAVATAATFVLLTPIDYAAVETYRLSGRVMEWRWVRLFSPFINTYAFIFLVGGAVVSAWRFRKSRDTYHRVVGNVLIAVGALLPGIGGTATRMGHVEVLYVTEILGIILIWMGYRWNIRPAPTPSRTVPEAALGISTQPT